jgi:hypothetical protein
MNPEISKKLLVSAVAGLLAGIACGGSTPPATSAADEHEQQEGAKHSCGGGPDHSCGAPQGAEKAAAPTAEKLPPDQNLAQ